MSYENMTYENILKRMIDQVTISYPDLDVREGSMIFNALAPAALELAIKYIELDNVHNESFVNTASREYLLVACSQMGMDISVFNASSGVHKGVFNIQVPLDSRWNCDLYNYVVTEYIGVNEVGNHEYRLDCETPGYAPNSIRGKLTPITFFDNSLMIAELTECLIEGEDETPDEDIRIAYSEFVNSVSTDGNVSQYGRWCEEYDGIGHYKIIPLWNGNNTVKVSILSASNRAASEELIAEFQEELDPGVTGMGNGKAPIGAFVTVTTAEETPINISAKVTMLKGYTDKKPIEDALNNYFSEVAYKKSVISYMTVGSVILSAEGIDSITDLKLNGGTADISLSNEQIATLGELRLEE